MVVDKSLRITCTCRIRALAPSELDVRASGTTICLRPHGRIGFHVTAAMGPRKSESGPGAIKWRKEKFGSHLDDVDLKPDRERIPAHTLEYLRVRVSDLPSRRQRYLLLLLGRRRIKIARYRGQRLASRGQIERGLGKSSSGWTVGALNGTLKNEDEPLLCVAPNVGVLGQARRHRHLPMVG